MAKALSALADAFARMAGDSGVAVWLSCAIAKLRSEMDFDVLRCSARNGVVGTVDDAGAAASGRATTNGADATASSANAATSRRAMAVACTKGRSEAARAAGNVSGRVMVVCFECASDEREKQQKLKCKSHGETSGSSTA